MIFLLFEGRTPTYEPTEPKLSSDQGRIGSTHWNQDPLYGHVCRWG